jgi:hypothetical protein
MKNTSISETHSSENPTSETEDMLSEYSFDYQQARPNRYAAQLEAGGIMVVLDPDIAQVFTTSEAVNEVLRACQQRSLPLCG